MILKLFQTMMICVFHMILEKDFTLEKFYKVYNSSFLKEWWSVNYNYNIIIN